MLCSPPLTFRGNTAPNPIAASLLPLYFVTRFSGRIGGMLDSNRSRRGQAIFVRDGNAIWQVLLCENVSEGDGLSELHFCPWFRSQLKAG